MIQHVALEICEPDAEACVRFWGLLGFVRVQPPPGLQERAAWVQRAGTAIHLFFVDEPLVPRSGHVAVIAEDYDATLAALRKAGCDAQPRTEYWGSPRCFVASPAGHRVEIMAFAPG